MRKDMYQQIMDAKQCMGCMHEGFIVTSTDGTIIETSQAAERILEAPSLSLKGRQVREICPVTDTYDELIRQVASGGRILNKSVAIFAEHSKQDLTGILGHHLTPVRIPGSFGVIFSQGECVVTCRHTLASAPALTVCGSSV